MRVVASVLILVLMPTVAFFIWAWMVKIVRERQLEGTLPHWQELPWTWLIIAGLTMAIAGVLYLVVFTDRPQGGFFGPQQGSLPAAHGQVAWYGASPGCPDARRVIGRHDGPSHARIAPCRFRRSSVHEPGPEEYR